MEKQEQEIRSLKNRKKYGLIWDEEKVEEDVTKDGRLPVLKEISDKRVSTKNKQYNVLIEGDNLHALSVLNYTHRRKIDVIYIDPPYNTGARDWQYNNNYVDQNDGYRHSKWLSFMDKRLKLAKYLLKNDGVLIVTIDNHELFALLGLLERMHAKILGIVCIVIKPEGRRQSKYIMESHEYAIFSTWGSPESRGLDTDFGLDFPEKDNEGKFRWEGLMRRDAGREDRSSDYWYPFYVSKNGKISLTKQNGYEKIMPINTKNIEKVWLWDKKRSSEHLNELNAVIRKDRITIYYKRRMKGRQKPTSVWFGSMYNANAYGTRTLTKILPNTKFNFPKSVYSVSDCVDLFLPKDGIVLDFFAGSGTTGHAVMNLNEKDGGNRTFILCTNNENKICEDVCYPRLKKVMNGYESSNSVGFNGLGGGLVYYKIEQAEKEPNSRKSHPPLITDANKRRIITKVTDIFCVKEWCFDLVYQNKSAIPKFTIYSNGNGKYMGIVYDSGSVEKFVKKINDITEIKKIYTYVFSKITPTILKNNKKIRFQSIPTEILEIWGRIFESNLHRRTVG